MTTTTTHFYALRADGQDVAFDAVNSFGKALQSAGLGKLNREADENVSHGERFRWTLKATGGTLEVVVHDDDTMPAMVLEVTGPAEILAGVLPLVKITFEIARATEVIETAKHEQSEDPEMLVLAAWVAGEAEEAAMVKLLEAASQDAEMEVRRGAAKAAAVQATPALRKLVEEMASRETDPKLASQLKKLLENWRPTR